MVERRSISCQACPINMLVEQNDPGEEVACQSLFCNGIDMWHRALPKGRRNDVGN